MCDGTNRDKWLWRWHYVNGVGACGDDLQFSATISRHFGSSDTQSMILRYEDTCLTIEDGDLTMMMMMGWWSWNKCNRRGEEIQSIATWRRYRSIAFVFGKRMDLDHNKWMEARDFILLLTASKFGKAIQHTHMIFLAIWMERPLEFLCPVPWLKVLITGSECFENGTRDSYGFQAFLISWILYKTWIYSKRYLRRYQQWVYSTFHPFYWLTQEKCGRTCRRATGDCLWKWQLWVH